MNGHIVYEGSAKDAVEHFARIGYTCPEYSNPADYFMIQVMQYKGTEEDDKRLQVLIDAYKTSKLSDDKEAGKSNRAAPLDFLLHKKNSCETGPAFSLQFKMLGWRALANFTRNKITTFVRLGQNIFMSLLIGLLYLGLSNNQSSISDRTGAVFIVMMNNFFTSVSLVILTFSAEKIVFLRENGSGLYSPSTYFVSKILSEYPTQLFFPLLYSSIVYFLVGFQKTAVKFGFFLLNNVLIVSVGQGVGLLVATLAPTSQVALAMFPVVVLPLTLLSGLFTTSDNLGPWIKWIEVLSPFKYGYRALMINEFKGLKLKCDGSEQTPPNSGICLVIRGDWCLPWMYATLIHRLVTQDAQELNSSFQRTAPALRSAHTLHRDNLTLLVRYHIMFNDRVSVASAAKSPRSSALVFGERDPIELVWTDVSYEVDGGTKTTRKILKEVSGSAAPGELVAIMGSSGAVSVCSRLG